MGYLPSPLTATPALASTRGVGAQPPVQQLQQGGGGKKAGAAAAAKVNKKARAKAVAKAGGGEEEEKVEELQADADKALRAMVFKVGGGFLCQNVGLVVL